MFLEENLWDLLELSYYATSVISMTFQLEKTLSKVITKFYAEILF